MWEDQASITIKDLERTEDSRGGFLFIFRYSFLAGKKDEGTQFMEQKMIIGFSAEVWAGSFFYSFIKLFCCVDATGQQDRGNTLLSKASMADNGLKSR